MSVLTVESQRQRRIAEHLRDLAVSEIEDRIAKDGDEAVAAILQLAPPGLKALVWREEWPLETAIRVVDALDLDVVSTWEELAGSAARNGNRKNGDHASAAGVG